MKSKVIRTNSIYSRFKENFKEFLSIFDATENSEEEIQLPEELKASLANIDIIAIAYKNNGTLFKKAPKHTKQQSHINITKSDKEVSKEKTFTRNIDDERERERER